MTTIARTRRSYRRPRDRRDSFAATPLTKAALVFGVILSIFPLYWMVVIASRTTAQAVDVPPPLLPGGNLGENVARVFATEDAQFVTGLVNSLIISSTVTFSVVVISTLAGYAFARLEFRGRDLLLGSILLTMMVPIQQMGVVPLYQLMVDLEWTGTLQAVILPFLLNGFGVFMMTQYTRQAVPHELVEAARVDGASTLRIYWNVILPAVRPGMAVLALQTFMLNWNEFMWPLIVMTDNPTVQVSISKLTGEHTADYALIFTGTAISVLPLLLVFIVFGRQIVGGLMEGAVKA
ncbi:carbohydrate ABC transporter permease [Spongiactinospora sp. TRM90649]|uniref:carbohydrate ABC transporter permease n=1 Tax=Spongiactinospora sp. TRM90649 TaxID=3031114 RepID=UPI0023F9A574|nr:carbohydrate ABC transporter permease [Spongiactinospora sp. TRM90649]MDF5753868.1 carbohydrate ABC transporter permease [Spongiactinospora sp. TRM90649]